MKTTSLLGLGALAVAALALAACAPAASTPSDPAEPSASATSVIAPVTMSATELQGATVQLVGGQVLNIDTGDLAVDSYTGTVADPAVAEFVPGRNDGSASFHPGVRALSAGTTTVRMVNAQGGIQPLTFTIDVAAR